MKAAPAALGCQVTMLRDEVRKARPEPAGTPAAGSGRPLDLPEPEPWPEPVDGAALLDNLEAALARHVVMAAEPRRAVALWVLHTHALDAAEHAPRLRVRSPEKRCGKSTLLDFLLETCCRPLPLNNTTPAALFRTVELARPTLLIDEADSFMRENEELRGLVNSGRRRSLAFVVRTVEVEGERQPRRFSTWCAMAIAGIGGLHGTVEDRSVVVELRRKLPAERVERFDRKAREALGVLARKAVRWTADRAAALSAADPSPPAGLNDRAADNWRPLLAIADAGGAWPDKARTAAVALAGTDGEDSLATELLADVRDLFATADGNRPGSADKLSSSRMVAELVKLEHRPWPELPGTGKALTARKMAVLLGRFGIAPEHQRDGNVYRRGSFTDAFGRYLAPEPGDEASTLHKPSVSAASGARRTFTPESDREGSAAAENPASARIGEGLRDRKPGEAPAWTESAAWFARLHAAGDDRDRRRSEVLGWGRAAGCGVDTSDGRLDLLVPKTLADCPAKFALLKQAQIAEIEVRTIEPGARH